MGTDFAFHVAVELAKCYIKGFDSDYYESNGEDGGIWYYDVVNGSAFAEFAKVVADTMREVDATQFQKNLMFSSWGDEWEKNVGDRTGIPLGVIRDRWLLLKTAAGTSCQ